jgi:hypothetical protein
MSGLRTASIKFTGRVESEHLNKSFSAVHQDLADQRSDLDTLKQQSVGLAVFGTFPSGTTPPVGNLADNTIVRWLDGSTRKFGIVINGSIEAIN